MEVLDTNIKIDIFYMIKEEALKVCREIEKVIKNDKNIWSWTQSP